MQCETVNVIFLPQKFHIMLPSQPRQFFLKMFFRKIFLGVDWQDWAILMVSYQLLGNYGTIPSKCVGPSMFPTIDPRYLILS